LKPSFLSNFKKRLGLIKRGVFGLIQNNLEKTKVDSDVSFVIGHSVRRKEIECYKIGQGKYKILFVSGTHGNEVGTIKLALKLFVWLKENIDRYKDFTFFVLPCLNPDGYELACRDPDYWHGGMIGRYNANNVDLNRNFETPTFRSTAFWAHGKGYREKSEVFSGEKPFSEPETQALANLLKKEEIKMVFAFHNAGKDVIGDATSQNLAKKFSVASGYKFESDKEWQKVSRTGTFKEWCEINNIAFLETEGSSRWGSDWEYHKKGISVVLESLSSSIG